MKDINVATGRWWRWTRYEIRDGYIRPARGAQLRIYDPWKVWLESGPPATSFNRRTLPETPYGSLLALSGELQYRQPGDIPFDLKSGELNPMLAPLSADSESKLLGWCARYGLLGVLPHRAVQVTLSPSTRVQTRYTKIGAGWIASEQQITQKQRLIPPGTILQPLRGAGLVTESLSATWSRFFPGVLRDQHETFPYPEPLTKEFWKSYAEPVADFLSGMQALREFHLAISLF